MERGKSSQGRGGKSKTPQYPADLFALGSKSAEGKRSGIVHGKTAAAHSLQSNERKRDPSTSALPPIVAPKKQKVTGSTILARAGAPSTSSGGAEAWEMVAIEYEPGDLVEAVLEADQKDEADKVVGLLCGAVRTLRNQRWKPDLVTYQSLMFLSKTKPSLFTSDCVVHALCSILKRDAAHNFKSKGNPLVPTLACCLLMRAFEDKKTWPDAFLKLYVEDSLGERVWVDLEECSGFVNNILTAVNSRVSPKVPLQPELSALSSARGEACPSPSTIVADDDNTDPACISGDTGIAADVQEKDDVPVTPRYSNAQDNVEQIVMDAVREQLNRRQPPENITRNFLRLLSNASGLVEVRLTSASRLEIWLQNPKLMRPSQELLMAVCVNCNTHTQKDIEVISHLVKIRLKSKALVSYYLAAIRELIQAHPDNLATVLKHTIYNELSTSRNPNNMAMLSVMFQSSPDTAAALLADIFQELLLNRDDYLRPLRALLREVVRVLRYDVNYLALCHGFMKDRSEISQQIRDFEFKDRMFVSVTDLVTLCIFLAISPAVREAASLLARGDKREIAVLRNFQMLVANIQKDAVTWLHETAVKMYRPTPTDFVHALHKVLFMEHVEQYYNKDMWPPENDRNLMVRLASEVPLLQNTLIRVFLIGLSKDHPLAPPDTLELADQLLKRAAALPSEGFPMLQADKLEIIDLMFNLSAYKHPENINLPEGYTPPQLAIIISYWKAWIMLLVLSSHNPGTFGSLAWEKYPTLRICMEMCITNHFTFPPPTFSTGEMLEEIKSKELQVAALEKQQILEFESYLAAASTKQTITEHTSLLLTQLITMDPTGPPRKPPQAVLDQLHSLNNSHRLGHLLCRSRHPDFLLDIIQRQGTSQSMPWLADLVENSEGALSHLPVQCLCEFLLSSNTLQPDKQHKHQQLLQHLQTLLTDINQEPQAPCEVLEYFLRRLSSPQTSSRTQAIKGLKMILSSVSMEEDSMDVDVQTDPSGDSSWLLRQLPQLPHFPAVRPQVVQALRAACQVENDPSLVSSYICFLAVHSTHDSLLELTDLVLDMAQLIVERSSIIAAILPSADHDVPSAASTQHALMLMFYSYLQKARIPRREAYTWSESQDQILVTWSTGEECTMHILVVHAIIILLNYGPGQDVELFENLLEIWFPMNQEPPKAYLVDTSEEALLIPDWLKLKMIRSNVDRLVDAALTDLDPPQLVLFIQSFGIPVKSMSKLLHTLDQAVTADPHSVGEAVLDKNYMAQLVEVQHHRGAEGGQPLVQVLHLEQPRLPDYSRLCVISSRKPPPLADVGKIVKQKEKIFIHKIPELISQIFECCVTSSTEKQQVFRLLQKTLAFELQKSSYDKSSLIAVITYINSAFMAPSSSFLHGFINSPQYAAPLLRLITTASTKFPKEITNQLSNVCHIIMKKMPSDQSPILFIVKQFLHRHIKREKRVSQLTQTQCPGKVLQSTPVEKLEQIGNSLIDEGLKLHQTKHLVHAIAELLVMDNTRPESTGLLIDWLAGVEPEIIGSSQTLQMQLLFSKASSESVQKIKTATQTCRPYLLTLLAHRASWATLYNCVQHLLNKYDDQYDCSAVLDFLSALTCNPKLWQGREKVTPKHHVPEDILELTKAQILALIEYIIGEAVLYSKTRDLQFSLDKLESRLPLLLQCVGVRKELKPITRHLLSIISSKDGMRSNIAHKCLLQLYLRIPGIIHYIMEDELHMFFSGASITEWSRSTLDSMSHTLLTALTASLQSKDWTKRSQEYELAARKMASVHPILVLRQLPMLAASLHGRVHLDFNVFRSRNHLTLFTQILGILELLQPHIFLKEHTQSLEDTLDSYFALFKYYGNIKDVGAILSRFMMLLQSYISQDAQRALKYLQKHAHILSDMQNLYPNNIGLRTLLSGISLPKGDDDGGIIIAATFTTPQAEPSSQWVPSLNAYNKMQVDEQVFLQDLEHASSRKPSILDDFVDPIADLVLSPISNVRTLAHTLLARHLRHNPSTTVGVSAFVRCLESDQPDVLNTALEKLPDVVLCAQEHALPLLQKVFNLGMCSNINTTPHISKAIALLNIQTGC